MGCSPGFRNRSSQRCSTGKMIEQDTLWGLPLAGEDTSPLRGHVKRQISQFGFPDLDSLNLVGFEVWVVLRYSQVYSYLAVLFALPLLMPSEYVRRHPGDRFRRGELDSLIAGA